jgi:hypothetical protein
LTTIETNELPSIDKKYPFSINEKINTIKTQTEKGINKIFVQQAAKKNQISIKESKINENEQNQSIEMETIRISNLETEENSQSKKTESSVTSGGKRGKI